MMLFSIPVDVARDNLTDLVIPISGFIITIVATVLTIIFVNKNTRDQIENQNKQTYKPRLKLLNIQKSLSRDLNGDYELMSVSKKANLIYNNSKLSETEKIQKTCTIKFNITLKNIGYGLAHDIKLYSLIDGHQVYGAQSIIDDLDQEMKSTEEIEINKESKFKISMLISKELIIKENDDDFILYLCNYKDLNNNNYQVLIGIIIKKIMMDDDLNIKINTNHYYYQEGTREYNGMIKKYKNNYNTIMKKIKQK